MRIAITTPTNWPYVRRGLERFVNELAGYLSPRGFEVDLISTKPGRGTETTARGYRSIYYPQLWAPALARLGIWEFHTFPLALLPALLRKRYDLVFCCTFLDAVTAIVARQLTGTPVVFWVNSVHPPIKYQRSLSTGGRFFRVAVRHADEMVVLSEYMQERLGERFGRTGTRIPAPVDLNQFRLVRERDIERPIILCTAALDDERKGGRLLMRAFNRVKERYPTARLQLSAAIPESKKHELLGLIEPRWRADVEFLGSGELSDLPHLYGAASIMVLCSRWESFGLVVLESLACGTPVVGTQEGAIPELLNRSDIGRLFEAGGDPTVEPSNLEGLTAAIFETLDLARDPATSPRCRAHAEQYGWDIHGPQFEELFRQVVAARQTRSPVRA